VKRQLATASRTIDETGTRSRAMERQLRSVEQLNPADAASTLALRMAAADGSMEDLEDQEVELE
jgi:DNA recombination protein RmuC